MKVPAASLEVSSHMNLSQFDSCFAWRLSIFWLNLLHDSLTKRALNLVDSLRFLLPYEKKQKPKGVS